MKCLNVYAFCLSCLWAAMYMAPAAATNIPIELCLPNPSGYRMKCDCYASMCVRDYLTLNCTGITEIPKNVTDRIGCLEILDGTFTQLNRSNLSQFSPNLMRLTINSSRVEIIESFADLPNLTRIVLNQNQLKEWPPVAHLSKLRTLNVTNNRITELRPGQLDGCTNLAVLNGGSNQIRVLRNGIFRDNCRLTVVDFSGNRQLTMIEEGIFSNTTQVQTLYFSHTAITHLPFGPNLRKSLRELFLDGTETFKVFNPFENSSNRSDPYQNRLYTRLLNVTFPYHALCCQLRNYTPLVPIFSRKKREMPSADSSGRVCVNVTGQAQDGSGSGFGGGSGVAPSEIVCIDRPSPTPSPMPTLTPTPSLATFTTQINRTVCLSSTVVPPSPTPSPTPTSEPPPTEDPCDPNSRYCNSHPLMHNCFVCQGTSCPTPSCMRDFPEMCNCFTSKKKRSASLFENHYESKRSATDNPLVPAGCSVELVDAECYSTLAATSTPLPTPSDMVSTTPPVDGDDDGGNGGNVDYCSNDYCDSNPDRYFCETCQMFGCNPPASGCTPELPQEICNCQSRKKRSGSTNLSSDSRRARRSAADSTLPEGYFYLYANSTDVFCRQIDSNISTGPTPTPPSQQQQCGGEMTCPCEVDLSEFKVSDDPIQCFPMEDDFNPCENLLGNSHVLRVFIWIVIIVALFGNALVILVFIGYSVFIRRAKQELFLIHFLYFNLAIADFLMGTYLFIIAVVDLVTLDDFSSFDIDWRTGPGCGFTGFCAIVSTMMSMYTLLVITLERTYTITFVMRRKLTKLTIGVVMVIGWIFAIIMGILPLAGISTYSSVAICLPFDVTEPASLGYVAFLLLITGLVFIVILVSYCIIFYQVALSPEKRRLVRSGAAPSWKSELKIALRMAALVLTNFVCWFPIALLGLTAAFGDSLIDVPTSKIFVVFVFPLNACLNPILYSLSSKIFRENLLLMLGKCGLFKKYTEHIRASRAGVTPSVTSNTSASRPSHNGGTIIERIRLLRRGSEDPKKRRDSAISQALTEETYFLNSRRSSNFSGGSNEEVLKGRRGSNFSGGSLEDQPSVGISNVGYRSTSPVGNSRDKDILSKRPKVSATSLGPVPEEGELPIAPTPTVVTVNPAYCDGDSVGSYCDKTDIEDGSIVSKGELMLGRNGVMQHKLFADSLPSEEGLVGSESPESAGNEQLVETTVISNSATDSRDSSRLETETKTAEMVFH